jgi:hypothetical protein
VKLAEVARTEEVFPADLKPEQCSFSHDRLAWRLENGRAVLVRYRIYKAHWGFPAEMPDLLPRSEYGIEVAVILSYLVYALGVSINKASSGCRGRRPTPFWINWRGCGKTNSRRS